ncbi:MAG: hypothetical protein J6W82_02155 [Bacteroidales bacterium]|nr:hypothetical protein [Bacteroidales bacterium]
MSFADILQSLERSGEQKLAAKLPSWAGVTIEVPASLNYQQCSSESTARYKASLLPAGARVADLTGGLGADSWAFSLRADQVWYNERDAVLLEAVKKNFAALGLSNVVFNGYDVSPESTGWQDALRAFRPDAVYLDPARRDAAGRKVFLLEDCSPDVVSLMPALLSLAAVVMVKVSPMADITMLRRRLSGWLSELHVVGSEGECKELLCLCRRNASFRGITLAEDGCVFPLTLRGRRRSSEATPVSVPTDSGKLLFVPSAAMVKSGLGPGMCLMDYDERLAPFGKYWQVIENLPFASSVIKDLGRRYPQADVTARGVPVSSEELRKKIRTKPGGPVHIFACILKGERRLLICTDRLEVQ